MEELWSKQINDAIMSVNDSWGLCAFISYRF